MNRPSHSARQGRGAEAPRRGRARGLGLVLAALALVTALARPAAAQGRVTSRALNDKALENKTPVELESIDIVDRAGNAVPKEIALRDQNGAPVKLGDYFDGERPVMLVMAYYACPMLCSLVLNGLMQGMKPLEMTTGKEYRTVVVSFDGRDTAETAKGKRAAYVEAYGRPVADKGWDFLVGDEKSVRALADAVGFKFRWDPQGGQFAHAAGAFAITPDGRVARTLYGLSFPEKTLKLALIEAGEGKVGSATEKILFYCFHYDPSAKGYVLASRRLMTGGGAVTVLVLGFFLLRAARNERKRARAERVEAESLTLPTPETSRGVAS